MKLAFAIFCSMFLFKPGHARLADEPPLCNETLLRLAAASATRRLSDEEVRQLSSNTYAQFVYLENSLRSTVSRRRPKNPALSAGRVIGAFNRPMNELLSHLQAPPSTNDAWDRKYFSEFGVYGIAAYQIAYSDSALPWPLQIAMQFLLNNRPARMPRIFRYFSIYRDEPKSLDAKVAYLLQTPPGEAEILVLRLVELGRRGTDALLRALDGIEDPIARRRGIQTVAHVMRISCDERYTPTSQSLLTERERVVLGSMSFDCENSGATDLHWTRAYLFPRWMAEDFVQTEP